jgi:hypothetical protein
MVYVGVDHHRKSSHVAVLADDGRQLASQGPSNPSVVGRGRFDNHDESPLPDRLRDPGGFDALGELSRAAQGDEVTALDLLGIGSQALAG